VFENCIWLQYAGDGPSVQDKVNVTDFVFVAVALLLMTIIPVGGVVSTTKLAVQLLFALTSTDPVAHSVPLGPVHSAKVYPGKGVAETVTI
jgi:hypothetical protein